MLANVVDGKNSCLRSNDGIGSSANDYGATMRTSLGDAGEKNIFGMPKVCLLILVVEVAERLVFYTLNGTQEFFLERIGIPLSRSAGLNATMSTLCMVWALAASWVADAVLGRYTTILVSGVMYVISVIIAAVAAIHGRESATLYFIGTLGILPIATAGIKCNISNLGADQYDVSTPKGKSDQEQFFSVFYLSINIGAGVAYGFFTTFAAGGGFGVSKDDGYATTYAIMACCMTLAVGIYFSGRRSYKVPVVQSGSALGRTCDLVMGAAANGSFYAMNFCAGVMLLFASIMLSVYGALIEDGSRTIGYVVFVFAAAGTLSLVIPSIHPDWLCSDATDSNTPSLDDHNGSEPARDVSMEVRGFLGVLPVLFVGTLAFTALYNSMAYWYQQQACQMDVSVNFTFTGTKVMLSGSFFNLADCMAIIIMTPLSMNYMNPLLQRAFGKPMDTGSKFAVGIGLGCASVLLAAKLELMRKAAPVLSEASNCAPGGVNMSGVSAAWMACPYFLMGVAEIYGLVTLMHYAYANCPASMRTLSSASFFFIQAVSSGIFAVETSLLSTFIPDDLNDGHLEFGYVLNLAIGMALFIIFVALLR
mmetsp:Transcript_12825/g.34448  ORF Transcript_12825/g.34448 Transcript_12825/m.34448 type:complete len:591 (-) Transcript_12825:39-1811(-)